MTDPTNYTMGANEAWRADQDNWRESEPDGDGFEDDNQPMGYSYDGPGERD